MNKHVESLPKVDSNLWRITAYRRHFLKKNNTNYIWFFAFQIFLKVSKFAIFSERLKDKSVSALRGLRPPDLLTRASAPGPRWRLRFQTPYYKGLTLVFWEPPTL